MMSDHPIAIVEYRDFYDVPRAFIIEPQRHMLLFFDCAFDEDRDDYGDVFSVAVLRSAERSGLPEDWRKLDVLANIGSIPISAVHFDDPRRREVVIDGLPDLVAAAERVYSQTHTVSFQ
jgi:hypothetical protein